MTRCVRSTTAAGTALSLVLVWGAAAATEDRPNPLAVARPTGGFVALSVADAAASARWYEEKLGFRVVKRIDPPNTEVHIVLMQNDGAILEILQHPTARKADTKEAFEVRGIFKAGFLVQDLDALRRLARERDVRVPHDVFAVPDFGVRSFIAADSDGNLIQFYGK